MSTIPDLTNLQAVQYSLDHPGVFLALTGDKITLVDKTGLDTSKVVSTAAWFVERTPDGTSVLGDAEIKISSPLQLHIKGSTRDADKVSKMVNDLLEINDQYRHVSTKGEYEAYVNLRNRKTCEEHCPWFKEDYLPNPLISTQTFQEFLKEREQKYKEKLKETTIKIIEPTEANKQTQTDEPFKFLTTRPTPYDQPFTFVSKRLDTPPPSDEAYTTNSSKPSSSTTSSACITPEPFQGELQKAVLNLEATNDSDSSSQSSDADWVVVAGDDKAPISKVDYSDYYLFADQKKMPLTNLVSVLSKNHDSSNYLSWDSTEGRFTLRPIDKSDTSPLVFLQLEDKFLSPKGLYVEKTNAQEIQAQIKSDKFNHTALKALKEHLISNHLKISSKASDVRI